MYIKDLKTPTDIDYNPQMTKPTFPITPPAKAAPTSSDNFHSIGNEPDHLTIHIPENIRNTWAELTDQQRTNYLSQAAEKHQQSGAKVKRFVGDGLPSWMIKDYVNKIAELRGAIVYIKTEFYRRAEVKDNTIEELLEENKKLIKENKLLKAHAGQMTIAYADSVKKLNSKM